MTQATDDSGWRRGAAELDGPPLDAVAEDIVRVREHSELSPSARAEIATWIDEEPERGQAIWTADDSRPLRWHFDGGNYSPTKLIREIAVRATGTRPTAMWGTRWWVDDHGRDLVELAGSGDTEGE